ncbi:amino acid ABC transporter ATP-binding protein [Lichenihabitans psoromatis]|uniref:amino acid ABC transporter ATP-binding protein n=1 Tax=Lichenihabitans psoromatis TaxID=2528642 RepID=UPI001FE10F8E|nr:amino acid ABC transporter ATP-binding protein [Lichenihabitans psoromatis]
MDVLDGIDIKVGEGEVVSLIGASGSGKSTFLRCINFLETPTAGTIEVAGEGVSVACEPDGQPSFTNKANIDLFRRRIGMVFQDFNLWPHLTTLENVIGPLLWVQKLDKREADDRARAVLRRVGMLSQADKYPERLSGGQQQRVAIARMLALRPRIMLFDEPTSALDPELVAEVLQVIRRLAEEGNTILLVTHEMRFARDVSTRVVFLHQGRIIEDDTPTALFGAPKTAQVRAFLSTTAMRLN